MELLYNPDSMREEEIKATFVGRHDLIEELVSLISHQPDGPGVQHVVIIAPRGMGKTTALLMAQFAVRESKLAESWQTVRFAEESYGVYDLSDLWIEALTRLAAATEDAGLLERAEELKGRYRESDDLQEAALALIKDWRGGNKKRLILLVDNFDMILEQINDERDNARLRDVLMNDGTMMLIGAATTFFREARAYDQPLYNFFKIYNLRDLSFEQMKDLLRRRAEVDRIPDFEEKLKANEGRLRVLEYFTGGNPRLVLMLYRVVTQSDISEVRRALEKLLDEVTPYYKAKVESLPPQQRKILEHIARVSSETREGVTPSQIAEATRLKPNQVSSQLVRLSELGYVRAADLRRRNSYYTLSEPLYAIWHQMRFGREARRRMQWLIDFLKIWYDATEIGTEDDRLANIFREHLSAGRILEARNALDHRRYLAEALDDSSARFRALDSVICSYLELKDFDTLKREVLTPEVLKNLSRRTLESLREAGCISDEVAGSVKDSVPSSADAQNQAEETAAVELGVKLLSENQAEEALQHFERVLKLNPKSYRALLGRAVALYQSRRFEEAIEGFSRVADVKSDDALVWQMRGLAYGSLGRFGEALASFQRAVEIDPDGYDLWVMRGGVLGELKRYEEARESFDRALQLKPDSHEALLLRGRASNELGRHEEALNDFDGALAGKPDDHEALTERGFALIQMGRYEEALAGLDRALGIKADMAEAWALRGDALLNTERWQDASDSYDEALKLNPNSHAVYVNKGFVLSQLNRPAEALACYDRAVELKPDEVEVLLNRGVVLSGLGRHEEALRSYDRVLEIDPSFHPAWLNRGVTLINLRRYEEAVSSFDRIIAADSPFALFARLMKVGTEVGRGNEDLAKEDWEVALKLANPHENEEWLSILSQFLLGLAREGHLGFVRQMIAQSRLEEQLFPLARAIDYLQSKDKGLIEKLSPEIRDVIEDMVTELSGAVGNSKPEAKTNTPKPKSGSRGRTKKQLR